MESAHDVTALLHAIEITRRPFLPPGHHPANRSQAPAIMPIYRFIHSLRRTDRRDSPTSSKTNPEKSSPLSCPVLSEALGAVKLATLKRSQRLFTRFGDASVRNNGIIAKTKRLSASCRGLRGPHACAPPVGCVAGGAFMGIDRTGTVFWRSRPNL